MKIETLDTYNTGKKNAFMNMAIDEILLQSNNPVLRLYQWKPAALSIGHFQTISDINQDYCKHNKINIVRRITGGKSVLHDKELTYCFIIDEKFMPASIIESYNIISNALILGLAELGIKAKMNPTDVVDKNNPNCFTEPSFNEVMVQRRKIIGSAQIRTKGKLLQHGSILLDLNQDILINCFNNKSTQKKKIQDRVITLKEIDKKININHLIKAIKNGFISQFNCELNETELSKEQIELSKNLIKKYKNMVNLR